MFCARQREAAAVCPPCGLFAQHKKRKSPKRHRHKKRGGVGCCVAATWGGTTKSPLSVDKHSTQPTACSVVSLSSSKALLTKCAVAPSPASTTKTTQKCRRSRSVASTRRPRAVPWLRALLWRACAAAAAAASGLVLLVLVLLLLLVLLLPPRAAARWARRCAGRRS